MLMPFVFLFSSKEGSLAQRAGSADLPLHHGRVPPWLGGMPRTLLSSPGGTGSALRSPRKAAMLVSPLAGA